MIGARWPAALTDTEGDGMSRKYRGSGYQSYYGRRSSGAGTLLKWIIVFLLAVLVVAVGIYFWLQNNLVYDDNGVYLPLPWKQQASQPPESPPPATESAPLPSFDAAPTDSVLVIDTPPPALTPREKASELLKAVRVSPETLLAGGARQQAERFGGNAVLVTMKNDDGTLNYVSDVELAVSMMASGSDPMANEAIRELTGGEYYTIAQVSCFRDEILGGVEAYALLSNSGYRWRDFNGIRWSCAGKAATRDYIVALCVELAKMGFDEILLTNYGYPPNGTGQMGWLRRDETYPWGALDTVVGPFLAQVKEAVEPYGTVLSVQALGKELSGEEQATGLTVENLLANCAHLWMDTDDALAYEEMLAANLPLREKLVPISGQAGGENEPWAMMEE